MIAIIDYKAGNLTSVKRAMDFLGQDSIITNDYSKIMESERIIFPGVGAAGSAMADLRALNLDKALLESYLKGKPILGICLGTQIIMETSQENHTRCLGLIEGETKRFPANFTDKKNRRLKVPHMGWNKVMFKKRHFVCQITIPLFSFYTPIIHRRRTRLKSWAKRIMGFYFHRSLCQIISLPCSFTLKRVEGPA